MPEVLTHPPVYKVPRQWTEYVDVLHVIAEFMDAIKGKVSRKRYLPNEKGTCIS